VNTLSTILIQQPDPLKEGFNVTYMDPNQDSEKSVGEVGCQGRGFAASEERSPSDNLNNPCMARLNPTHGSEVDKFGLLLL
jgi:hypothetical protein